MTQVARQSSVLRVRINRKTPPSRLLPFADYFKGFEKVDAVRDVFGDKTDAVLQKLKVAFVSNRRMYMGIRDQDGNIGVSTYHLKHSDLRTLYLDVIHELFHVKQFMKNRKYFRKEHMKFMLNRSLYYESPIEIPAYKHTVREAERIGMSYDEIVEYLKMGPEPPEVFSKFLEVMELRKQGTTLGTRTKLPVRINRNASVALFPFTDYFKGFEKVDAVKALFGDGAEEVLGNLKVEFVQFPFRAIFPSEEDGHLQVSAAYFKKGGVNSIYLDVLLCLNLLKRFSEGKQLLDSKDQELGESSVMLESYKSMLQEGRRLGMSDAKMLEHLQLPRFLMSSASYNRFVRELGLSDSKLRRKKEL